MSQPELYCVAPEMVAQLWPHVKHLLRSAIERTALSDFAEFERDVLAGNQLLWLIWSDKLEGAGTTRLDRIGRELVCTITALAGVNMKTWLPLQERIEQYARDEGCSCLRAYGRKGWARAVNGYKIKNVILEKTLWAG